MLRQVLQVSDESVSVGDLQAARQISVAKGSSFCLHPWERVAWRLRKKLLRRLRRGWNSVFDLEEDVEEEFLDYLAFPLSSLTLSATMISAKMHINSAAHLKGDCHRVSAVYRHSPPKGSACRIERGGKKAQHWLQEAASYPPTQTRYVRRSNGLSCGWL